MTDAIHMCDAPFCSNEAKARMYVIDRKGKVMTSCNACPVHMARIRDAANPKGKYRLREGPVCERAAAWPSVMP